MNPALPVTMHIRDERIELNLVILNHNGTGTGIVTSSTIRKLICGTRIWFTWKPSTLITGIEKPDVTRKRLG